MIPTDEAFRRLAQADPVPADAERPLRAWSTTTLLDTVDQRSGATDAGQAGRSARRLAPSERRRGNVLVAAAAFAFVVIAIGAAVWLARPAVPEREVATTVAPEPDSLPGLGADLAETVNRGDLDAALTLLSPQSDCDLPVPGSNVETCGELWGELIAIGGTLDVRCAGADSRRCSTSFTSELFAIMGYPDIALPGPALTGLDGDGRVIADASQIPVTRAYMPEGAGDRLYTYLRQHYPEFDHDPVFGPQPASREVGLAKLEAARALTDPARIVAERQAAFDNSFASPIPGQCLTQDGTLDCAALFAFLRTIDAELDLDCDPDTAEGGILACPLTITSDIHTILGGGPASTEAELMLRGGVVARLTLELRFAADAALHDAFAAYAAGVDGLYRGPRPIYEPEAAPAWLAAAEAFAEQ